MSLQFPTSLATQLDNSIGVLFRSWLPVVLLLLLTFALGISHIEDFPMGADELMSVGNAGYFSPDKNPFSVLPALADISPQHVPGFFFVLSIWGDTISWHPFILKLLSTMLAILSLAVFYRFASDVISREAGFVAVFMLGTLTYFHIWYVIIRMYTLFIFAELIFLWIYYRMVTRKSHTTRDYAALVAATFFFINTHILSLSILIAVGLYHLIFVPKTRHWFNIVGCFVLAAILFSPWMIVLLEGFAIATGPRRVNITSTAMATGEVISSTFYLGLNGNWLLLSLLGLSAYRLIKRDRLAIALFFWFSFGLLFFAGLNEFASLITVDRSRYLVVLFPLMILIMILGVRLLPHWRIIMVAVFVLWLASAFLLGRRISYRRYSPNFGTIAVHLVEQHIRDELQPDDAIIGFNTGMNFDFERQYGKIIDFYFNRDDITLDFRNVYQIEQWEDTNLDTYVSDVVDDKSRVWLIYEPVRQSPYEEVYRAVLNDYHVLCRRDDTLAPIVIELYQSDSCDP